MGDVVFRNEMKSDVVGSKVQIGVMYEDNFGVLLPYIRDIEVTDINWNGKELWVDDVNRGRYCPGIKLEKEFIDAFCIRVANVVSKTFNKYYPVLEAETDDLRITIVHHSRSHTGTTISIRKTPIVKRITFAKSIKEDYYCPEKVANLLSNSVKAKFNIVIGGLPGVGKTELIKYLTNYIFPRDRVITIEDTMEVHYSQINPHKDCVELKVDESNFTYTDAIKACLRLLPQWIILSEARSKEVQYLLESISTGAKCMTTIHTDDMRKVPKRVVNMMGDMDNSSLAESMAYTYFDLGILVDKVQDVETGKISRFIAQVVMYHEEKGEGKCSVLYNRGEFTDEKIPLEALYQFHRMGIADPWEYTFIQDTHVDVDDITGFLDDGLEDEAYIAVDDTTGITGTSTSRYMDADDEASGELGETVYQGGFMVDEDGERAPRTAVEKMIDNMEDKLQGKSSEKVSQYPGTVEDDSDKATGYVDEYGDEPTGYVEESDEDSATGYVSSPEETNEDDETTGYVAGPVVISEDSSVSDDEDEATGCVEGEFIGEDEATGCVDEISDEDAATGYVSESNQDFDEDADDEATGCVDNVSDAEEAPTGYVDSEEAATGFVDASPVITDRKKKRRGSRGRR